MFKTETSKVFEISDYSNREELPEDAWRVRPCEWYKDEYSDCKSIKSRFHQYFVYGETLDCSQWKKDFDNCKLFRNANDTKSLEAVLESEKKRFQDRKNTVNENDVWEYRSEPPENWNTPMPEWMIEKKKNSILNDTQNLLNEGKELTPVFTGMSCCIM